jgi:hypothetical protein
VLVCFHERQQRQFRHPHLTLTDHPVRRRQGGCRRLGGRAGRNIQPQPALGRLLRQHCKHKREARLRDQGRQQHKPFNDICLGRGVGCCARWGKQHPK